MGNYCSACTCTYYIFIQKICFSLTLISCTYIYFLHSFIFICVFQLKCFSISITCFIRHYHQIESNHNMLFETNRMQNISKHFYKPWINETLFTALKFLSTLDKLEFHIHRMTWSLGNNYRGHLLCIS